MESNTVTNEIYDVAIVGGGISGVGIAQFAAAAGYSTLLVEQGEIGGQTSANSSKLIHGGLRYLETAQLNLVRQSLRERRHLLKLAPNLVKAVPFYIPVYEDSQRSALTIRAGLSLYAVLSEFDPLGRFVSVPAVHWHKIRGLKLQGLKAVFQYYDAQTDDQLLTQAVARSAQGLGAVIYAHSPLVQLRFMSAKEDAAHEIMSPIAPTLPHSSAEHPAQADANANAMHGHTSEHSTVNPAVKSRANANSRLGVLEFRHQDSLMQARAKVVINATGPWVNDVLAKVSPPTQAAAITWVQGSHLLLDIPAPDGILYLESCFDKRVIFVMPWFGQTLIGTTETELSSLATPPIVTQDEIQYLLGIYRHYFPHSPEIAQLTQLIVKHYCGVRVLPKQNSQAFERPRDTLMHTTASHPNLLSLYGGKLTTFRSTSAQVLDWIEQRLGKRVAIADVDKLPLG